MNIEEITIKQAQELVDLFNTKPTVQPYEIGKHYQIRTVTMIYTGRVLSVGPQELVIDDAAWIADTGRFTQATATQDYNEVEPFPDGPVIVGRGAIVDAVQIKPFTRSQK